LLVVFWESGYYINNFQFFYGRIGLLLCTRRTARNSRRQ